MSAAEQEKYVRQALQMANYRDVQKTKIEVMEVLKIYQGLKPSVEPHFFNNGTQKQLLNLNGTIPANYKGSTYNIPIGIWLLDTHPINAPIVYVKPTNNMQIKVSIHVDHTGKVYLPYLHEWNSSSELMILIQILIVTFGEQPPVYAVNNNAPLAQPPGQAPYPTQSYGGAPYPSMPSMPMPMPYGGTPGPATSSSTSPLPGYNVRPSLISAAEEKLRRRLEEVYLTTEIAKKTGEQLVEGRVKLESMLNQLESEKSTLDYHISKLENEISQLEEKIEKQKTEENSAIIDEAINAPTTLHKQIVNTFAEEAALDDTIYYLGEAFRRERLDLEQYLKHVRALSRRQFMHRALLQKCRLKAGLAG